VETIEAIGGEAAAGAPMQRALVRDGEIVAPVQRGAPGAGRIRSGKLVGLTMSQAIWVLSWPVLAESFLGSLVGIVDTTLAAGISAAAADAIGAASYIAWALALIGLALGTGATAIVARSLGKGRNAVANAAVGQTVILSLSLGVVVAAIVFVGAPALARVLNLSAEAAKAMVVYLRVIALGVPALSLVTACIACQRGAGDAKRPLAIMLTINALNIPISWVLSGVDIATLSRTDAGELTRKILIENPFSFDVGILGVALGTLAAQLLGACIVLAMLARGGSGVRLRARRLRPHWHTMRRLVRVGMPNFFESVGMWTGNFLVLLLVGFMGSEGLYGAHIVAIRIESLSFLPGFAMGLSAATLAGQYLGAGSVREARNATLRCTAIAATLMGTMGLLFILFPERIVGVLTQQPEHLAITPTLVRMAGFVQIPFAIMLVLRNALRGVGDTRAAMFITWFSTFAVRLPLAWLLSGVDIPLPGDAIVPNPGPDWGLRGLWIGLLIELVIRSMLFAVRFSLGAWKRLRV